MFQTYERRQWRVLALLIAAFTALLLFSLFLAGAKTGIATVWPSNAVLVAGVMTLPRRQWTWLLAIAGAIHLAILLMIGDPPLFSVTVSVLDTVQAAVIGLLLLRLRIPTRPRGMDALLRLTVLAALATVATSVPTAMLGALSLGLPAHVGWSDWLTSNVLGMALTLPTALILLDPRRDWPRRGAFEQVALLALCGLVTAAVFGARQPSLQILIFPAVLLAAFRGGPREAATGAMMAMIVSIPVTLWAIGDAPELRAVAVRHLLVFHCVLYAVSLASAMALGRQLRLQAMLLRRQAVARAAQARAQAANLAKSDFLATMSHEIRTPLNSILGFADLVAVSPDMSPENQRRLALVARAGESLVVIVDDLLDFAKVEAGAVVLDPRPVSPAGVLRDAAGIVAADARAKGLVLRLEIAPEGEADRLLDGDRLRQVLLNLLNNAVKFTAAGSVTARLAVEGDRLRFEVLDTGIGIDPAVQGRLFQRFTQADSSITRGYGGAGLGLAISRALVRLMGGAIGVDSRLGQGACFWLEVEAPRDATVASADPTAPVALGARVLLVDDHPMNRELGSALLILAGCQVETAQDGIEAVEAATRGGFDLILMDIHMPRMDGLAAARAIRALPGQAGQTPIIALSADVLPHQVERCRQAGMVDHLAKPLQRQKLHGTLRRWLAKGTATA